MADSGTLLTFIIVSFCLAFIVLMTKETLPTKVKRPLAILAIIMISLSFVFIVLSFYRLGR